MSGVTIRLSGMVFAGFKTKGLARGAQVTGYWEDQI